MIRRLLKLLALACACAAVMAPVARADFGISSFDVRFTGPGGEPVTQAGSHPFAMTTFFSVNTRIDPELGEVPEGSTKDLTVELPAGVLGNPTATPRCSGAEFAEVSPTPPKLPACSNSTVVGVVSARIKLLEEVSYFGAPVYNLEPPPGVAAKLGFVVLGAPVTIEASINPKDPHNVIAKLTNTTQAVAFYGSALTIWGNPADPAHDAERGSCVNLTARSTTPTIVSEGNCPVNIANKPFLTMPTSCSGPLVTRYEVNSWQSPGVVLKGSSETHDNSVPPNPLGLSGCANLSFAPSLRAQPTATSADSASGMDVDLTVKDEGILSPTGLSQSQIHKTVVTLPPGVTINPSQAEGLGVCTEAEWEGSAPDEGHGCPEASKIGTVEVETPLLEGELLKGALYVAAPYANPYGSLIGLYVVIRDPKLGIVVPLAGKVEPDGATGQLVSTFDNLPELPISHFHLHFREGGRSPLATPPQCGEFQARADFVPWSNLGSTYSSLSSFLITSGIEGGACPSGGVPPFSPLFEAGSINNAAGSFSPFDMRIIRADGQQDLTRFSATLPRGVTGKIASATQCPQASVEVAKGQTGLQEKASPSCPASSQIGRTLTGVGVGSELTYVPGQLYLGGPYHGDPLSVVAVVPAVAGPFDVGTVVVQEALTLNPYTAEVEVDGAASDPIPHILAGIPLSVRDLRVYADRPEFTLNPTNCEPEQAYATLWGGGADPFTAADDAPVTRTARYQAAGCANLPFKPRLSLRLRGGTKRAASPGLTAVLAPRPGDANIGGVTVILPHSAFLDQAHIRTLCTRVQFNAGSGDGAECPKASVYGHARAFTPLLKEPLEGPVFLRANGGERNLPDLVMALHGLVNIDVVGFVDSVHRRLRTRFQSPPDAPVTRLILTMAGGKRSLIENSYDVCLGHNRAGVTMVGQNGRVFKQRPQIKADCGKAKGRSPRTVRQR